MPHVLFISYDGMTDPLGQSQVIPYLSGLVKYGYRFTIISCEKKERFIKSESRIRETLLPFQIKWIPLTYHKNPPILSAIYDLVNIKRTAKRHHKLDPFDMVHTRSGTSALAGLWMKKKFGIRFLNDIRDFYSQSRIDSGQWKQSNPIFRMVFQYFNKKEREALIKNDGIVCLTHKADKIIKSDILYKMDVPLEVIPCSVDLNLFNPQNINLQKKNELKNKLNFEHSDIVFTYLGSVGTWYLSKEMFSFFKAIENKISNAKFLIISPDDPNVIKRIMKEVDFKTEKTKIISASRSEVPLLLSLSSYSVFFIKPCFSKQASSPTKLGEIMAMGIPVITNAGVGDVKEIVEKYQAGIVLNNLKEENFKKISENLLKMNFDSKMIIEGAKEYFNLENAVLKYKHLYDQILSLNNKRTLRKVA
ncbi:MAG: glycosyltransferase [Ginsengibacter sp.]